MNALPEFIRPGAIVRLKSGNRARIYAVDGGKGFPIHGSIELNGEWIVSSWREDLSWSNISAVGSCWTIVGPDRPDYSALWPILPPWIRFLARDADGWLFAYSVRPTPVESEEAWANDEHYFQIPLEFSPPPVGDWRDSLAERPTP